MTDSTLPPAHDKILFTPGPLTTSAMVKQAMLCDLGSRDQAFIDVVAWIQHTLLRIAGVDGTHYAAIPMQGSGTFGLEAVLSSVVPREGKILLLINGAYGRRLKQIAERLGIATFTRTWAENVPVVPVTVAETLEADLEITHVAVCHCETTSGVMNPVREVGRIVQDKGRCFIVDAMSSFGAVPVHLEADGIDYLISSANKCIEGVPGFSFVLARLANLLACEGWARSVALDLLAQYRGLIANGQFRFTPPTHALLAFKQALLELEAEGGVAGRAARYRKNHEVLMHGMSRLGFDAYVPTEHQGSIITTFLYPEHPNFEFTRFYDFLNARGYVIYPGKVTEADCFRIGTIGRISPVDVEALVLAIAATLADMDITLPAKESETLCNIDMHESTAAG